MERAIKARGTWGCLMGLGSRNSPPGRRIAANGACFSICPQLACFPPNVLPALFQIGGSCCVSCRVHSCISGYGSFVSVSLFLYGCRISISHAHSRPLLSLSHSLFPLVVLVLVLPLQTPERADICARTRCDRYLGDRHGFGMYFYAEHPDEPHQEYVGQVNMSRHTCATVAQRLVFWDREALGRSLISGSTL